MFFKNKNFNIVTVLIIIIVVISFLSIVMQPNSSKAQVEGFKDLINLEKFSPDDADIAAIKASLSDIQKNMTNGYPDMSKYAFKSEIPPTTTCRVTDAVDKDAYLPKTEVEKLSKCPVPMDYDPSRYILKSIAQQPQLCPECPTLDQSKYVLKSTLPPTQKCPDCKCPQVKVSAGLCQKCPPPPKCPEPKPCPVVECPPPKPCPPQQECPACPPKEACPPKICPPCPIPETPTLPPGRANVVTIYRTVNVDQNGNVLNSSDSLTPPKDCASSYSPAPQPTASSGLATPRPTIGSTNSSFSEFQKPTEAPFVQSFKVDKTKSCQPNAFNSEFKQFGVYADNSSNHYSMN
jgi:hypothetical protein